MRRNTNERRQSHKSSREHPQRHYRHRHANAGRDYSSYVDIDDELGHRSPSRGIYEDEHYYSPHGRQPQYYSGGHGSYVGMDPEEYGRSSHRTGHRHYADHSRWEDEDERLGETRDRRGQRDFGRGYDRDIGYYDDYDDEAFYNENFDEDQFGYRTHSRDNDRY